jgi:hypothetical protein
MVRTIRITLALLTAAAFSGCSFFTGEQKAIPPPIELSVATPYQVVRTLAIAPAINLTGSRDFDPLVVSDILYAEMQQVQGLNVMPLNKTLIVMQKLQMRSLERAEDVQRLAEALGADGVVVPAVTAYDPYNPPTIGMILQLYTPPVRQAPVAPAPAAAVSQRSLRSNPSGPVVVELEEPKSVNTAAELPPIDRQPASQVTAVFNANNQTVLKELEVFANGRTKYDSALRDKKFLVDSESYMRFVAHAMVRRLMDVERTRLFDR